MEIRTPAEPPNAIPQGRTILPFVAASNPRRVVAPEPISTAAMLELLRDNPARPSSGLLAPDGKPPAFEPRPSPTRPEGTPRRLALDRRDIVQTAKQGADLLSDVARGLLTAEDAEAAFGILVQRPEFSSRARSGLGLSFRTNLQKVLRTRRPERIPVFPTEGRAPSPPIPPAPPSGIGDRVAVRNGPVPDSPRPETASGTRQHIDVSPIPEHGPRSFAEETGFTAHPLSFDQALVEFSNHLEAHGNELSRFSGSLDYELRPKATSEARSVIDRLTAQFWRSYGSAIDSGDVDLRRAALQDFGNLLGGETVLYSDIGFADAVRVYAILSAPARQIFADAFSSGLNEARKGRWMGILDTEPGPFSKDSVPEAVSILRPRRPWLNRARDTKHTRRRPKHQTTASDLPNVNRIFDPEDAELFEVIKKFEDRGVRVAVLPDDLYPGSVEHIIDARNAGVPTIWTFLRPGTQKRRQQAQKGHEKVPDRDLDEVPFASVLEGGADSSVRPLLPADNRGSGRFIRHELGDIEDYDQFVVVPVRTMTDKLRRRRLDNRKRKNKE